MSETPLEAIISWLLSLVVGVLESIINCCVIIGLLYGIFYMTGRFLICQNKKDEWEEFLNDSRVGMKDLIKTLKEISHAVYESAKHWASQKIESLKFNSDSGDK